MINLHQKYSILINDFIHEDLGLGFLVNAIQKAKMQ